MGEGTSAFTVPDYRTLLANTVQPVYRTIANTIEPVLYQTPPSNTVEPAFRTLANTAVVQPFPSLDNLSAVQTLHNLSAVQTLENLSAVQTLPNLSANNLSCLADQICQFSNETNSTARQIYFVKIG